MGTFVPISSVWNRMRPTAAMQNKKTKEFIALDRQGTQQQRPESPMGTLTWQASNTRHMWLRPRVRWFGENVQLFIPHLRLYVFALGGDLKAPRYDWCAPSSTVAQWAEATVAKCFLTSCVWALAHSNFVRSRVYTCLGVTCNLHFWQNDRGLLRATVITQGWNGHWIRLSTQS